MVLAREGIINGPRLRLRAPPTVVTDSAARLPPCSPRMMETMSYLPVTPSAMRMATSLASEPVTVKLTTLRLSGRLVPSSSANAMIAGLLYQDEWCTNAPACSRRVSVNSGWL